VVHLTIGNAYFSRPRKGAEEQVAGGRPLGDQTHSEGMKCMEISEFKQTVVISSSDTALIMSKGVYNRARRGRVRGKKLRNPVERVVGGTLLVFTMNEWKTVCEGYIADEDIALAMGIEIKEKKDMSRRLSKYRDLRAIIEANTFAAREMENRQTRMRPTRYRA